MQFRWRTPQMEASLAVRENTPHGRDQSIEFYRLAVELVATPRRAPFRVRRRAHVRRER
jgi:hypothetical protein